MLDDLKKAVFEANMLLPKYGLVTFTWGNVSGIDREKGLFVIKPSGVPYEDLKPEDMVVMDLSGNKVEGRYNPSTDTATHCVLYNAFPEIGGVVHTHSPYATSFAQAGCDIECMGTTHADYFYGPIPCIRNLTATEMEEDYEGNTGKSIVDGFHKRNIDSLYVPGCICKNHGPFAWGRTPYKAVYNAKVLEEVARMNIYTKIVNPLAEQTPQYMQDKHFMRKHGPNAYYGQGKE